MDSATKCEKQLNENPGRMQISERHPQTLKFYTASANLK